MLANYSTVDLAIPGLPAPVQTAFVGPSDPKKAGSDPPILLIHGFDSSAVEWRRTFPLLAAQTRTYAIDVFGCAASSHCIRLTTKGYDRQTA